MKKFAVIFDMDGVISDTQKIHAATESVLLATYGISITPDEICRRFSGYHTATFFEEISKEQGVSLDIATVVGQKWDAMSKHMDSSISEIPGVRALITLLSGIPLAVASSSSPEFIREILEGLNLTEKFASIVSGEEVLNGKPAPDIFLEASRQLNVPPDRCVVIEDGVAGMQGAASAGMKCIALVQDNRRYPADLMVHSLNELSVETFTTLLEIDAS